MSHLAGKAIIRIASAAHIGRKEEALSDSALLLRRSIWLEAMLYRLVNGP